MAGKPIGARAAGDYHQLSALVGFEASRQLEQQFWAMLHPQSSRIHKAKVIGNSMFDCPGVLFGSRLHFLERSPVFDNVHIRTSNSPGAYRFRETLGNADYLVGALKQFLLEPFEI